MRNFPLASHITFGTYGARLHGCDRPHVDKEHNVYGTPFPPTGLICEQHVRESMARSPVKLTIDQRRLVEEAIRSVCTRFDWPLHTIAVQSDHVHLVITAEREGDSLREAIKAAASRALNDASGKQRWWAEGGSDKYLFERDYFSNAVKYVNDQRGLQIAS